MHEFASNPDTRDFVAENTFSNGLDITTTFG